MSIKPIKVQALIKLISDNKKIRNIVQAIYFQNTFSFTYDIHKSAKVTSEYLDLRHDTDDFNAKARVTIEFQAVLYNFKVLKRINAVKAYIFRLLEVYLIDKLTNSIILTLEKRR